MGRRVHRRDNRKSRLATEDAFGCWSGLLLVRENPNFEA